jgi:outer membrane protein OmpA-like peptidoglycan-associated protein
MAATALSACGNGSTVETPASWWHDLEGGQIAKDRPPPPGADQPYPLLGNIPARPVVPSNSFRQTVQTQLTQQRDDTERLAARTPIEFVPAPPPGQAPVAADDTANATLPGADAAAPPQSKAANPAAPPPNPPAPSTAPGATAAAMAAPPAPGTPITVAGAPLDEATPNLPPIPDAPPPPASFEGVPALPAPTPPPPLPAHTPPAQAGLPVLFRPGDATLDNSQMPTLHDAANHRGHGNILVEGHGDTTSDSPAAQQTALELGLKRAEAIAHALTHDLHVPQDRVRLSATAFGRDASVRLIP